jgi:ribosomal protein L11 methyltransferase
MWCLRVTCSTAAEDPISGILAEPPCRGAEVLALDDGTIEFRAYYRDRSSALRAANRLGDAASRLLVGRLAPIVEPFPDADWLDEWRRNVRPVQASPRFMIAPPWEVPPAPPDGHILVLEPRQAFGTGTHPTTQLCLAALEGLIESGDRVLDVGTGTGILALAMARLCAREVLALDVDPQAVAEAHDNARVNGLAGSIIASGASVGSIPLRPAYDGLAANITRSVITAHLGVFKHLLKPGGWLVLSGLLVTEQCAFEHELNAMDLAPESVTTRDEWCCVVARRSSR